MGISATMTRIGFSSNAITAKNAESPYSQLAASIIIQALDDLKALNGCEKVYIGSSVVSKWEIINFLRSRWCSSLLTFQNAVTQEHLEKAAWNILEKTEG